MYYNHVYFYYQLFWCLGPESNRHSFRRGILSPLCLPISPPRHNLHLNVISWDFSSHASLTKSVMLPYIKSTHIKVKSHSLLLHLYYFLLLPHCCFFTFISFTSTQNNSFTKILVPIRGFEPLTY
jgi:hypothetical protein